MTSPSSICPRCHSPIPADAPGGICPSCALLGAVEPTDPTQAAAASVPTVEEIAAAFPEFQILGIIGHGGMGVVFKGRQPRLDRLVALKVLPPALAAQPGFAERFTREARALARLAHPHIVAVYDFGVRAGFYYLIMEYVDGVNLRQALQAGVTPEQSLQLVPRICEALQFAHDHGVLHRDIKPENILLDRQGTPKLADFGIAKLAGDKGATGLTGTGAALGTAAYMAPEQIEKPATVDHRADIYSLGVVLYEMLTGELPLGRFAAPSEKSKVGRGVDEVVLRALEKERSRRQQSATEMKTQVEGASAWKPAPPVPPPAAAHSPELLWVRVFKGLTSLSAGGIAVSAMLHWHKLTPVHMVALTIVFGILTGVAKSFVPRTSPSGPVPAREKDLGIAYLLWFLFGLVGGHRFYLGQIGWGLLYLFTGGLFCIGWIVDLFTLPAQVRSANEALSRGQPPGSIPTVPAGPSSHWPQTAALIAFAVVGLLFLSALAGQLKIFSSHLHISVNGKDLGPKAARDAVALTKSALHLAEAGMSGDSVKIAQARVDLAEKKVTLIRTAAAANQKVVPSSELAAAEAELKSAREELARLQPTATPKSTSELTPAPTPESTSKPAATPTPAATPIPAATPAPAATPIPEAIPDPE